MPQLLRQPTLGTIVMVETYLKEHKDKPITLAELKEGLPKQVMHQTLKTILDYLWESGKIMYGPKGFQWIYVPPSHLQTMLEDAVEV